MRDHVAILVASFEDGSREIVTSETMRASVERRDGRIRTIVIEAQELLVEPRSAAWTTVDVLRLDQRRPVTASGRVAVVARYGGLAAQARVSLGVGLPPWRRTGEPEAWIEPGRDEDLHLARRIVGALTPREIARLLTRAPASDSLLAVPIVGQRRSIFPPVRR